MTAFINKTVQLTRILRVADIIPRNSSSTSNSRSKFSPGAGFKVNSPTMGLFVTVTFCKREIGDRRYEIGDRR